MTAAALLRTLRTRGARVRALPGGRLGVSPGDVLTPALREAIQARRAELLERLRTEEPPAEALEREWRTAYRRAREALAAAGVEASPAELEITARALLDPRSRLAPLVHGPLRRAWLDRVGELERRGYLRGLAEQRSAWELGLLVRLPTGRES